MRVELFFFAHAFLSQKMRAAMDVKAMAEA